MSRLCHSKAKEKPRISTNMGVRKHHSERRKTKRGGGRKTLLWICGGAKLPSGATWPACTAKAGWIGLISAHTSSPTGKMHRGMAVGAVAWAWPIGLPLIDIYRHSPSQKFGPSLHCCLYLFRFQDVSLILIQFLEPCGGSHSRGVPFSVNVTSVKLLENTQ